MRGESLFAEAVLRQAGYYTKGFAVSFTLAGAWGCTAWSILLCHLQLEHIRDQAVLIAQQLHHFGGRWAYPHQGSPGRMTPWGVAQQ
jgi:hypothetical protein